MSDIENPPTDTAYGRGMVSRTGEDDRVAEASTSVEAADGAADRHIAVAVPIRAVERNRRVASSVLAGGFAYRIFLWLLPLGLLLGGALGLSNAESTEDAVDNGGLPGAITNAVGDAARAAESDSWWLFAIGVPLLLWAGFTGAKAILLIHSLVWDEPPPRPKPLKASLAFTGVMCAVWATIALTWWVREDSARPPGARDHGRAARGAVAVGFPSASAPGRSLEGAGPRGAPRLDRLPCAPPRQSATSSCRSSRLDLAVRRSRRHDHPAVLRVHDGAPRRRCTRPQQLALRRAARAEARRSARLNAGRDDALHPICVMWGCACWSTIGGTSDSQITEERNER